MQGEDQEVRGGVLCVQRAGERAGARMWRGHARASHPFRITGRGEMVMAARVVVRVAVVRLRAKETVAMPMVRAATRRGW